jgi:hypothetical protein
VAGRAAIQAFYERMFAGPLKDVAKTVTIDRVRFVTPTVAVVDSSYTLRRERPPLHARGASLTVLENRHGAWVSVVSRSYRLPSEASASSDSTAGDELDEHHGDGDDQQEVDETSQRVRAHHPQEPEDEQDHEDRPEHALSFRAPARPARPAAVDMGAQPRN